MSLIVQKASSTIGLTVLVAFIQPDGTSYQGDFRAEVKRLPTEEVDAMIDADPPLLNSEIVDRVLVSVSKIGNEDGSELPPDEQLRWVKSSPECVNATVAAFFRTMRPDRYDGKTSKRSRGRG